MSEYTLKDALTAANPSNIADALRLVDLGLLLQPVRKTYTPTEDSPEIILDPPAISPAMFVANVAVDDGNTGTYIATTGQFVPATSGALIGACQMSADGRVVSFSGNVVSATLCYFAAPKTPLATEFAGTGIK